MASQALQAIRWQTPVDLNPQYSGNDLLIHYGSPLMTSANTIIVPVKTGATNGFKVEGLNGLDGSVLWTQTTDYILPSHNWTPSYSPTLTAQNRLYFAGAGGTVYYLDNPDTPGSHAVGRHRRQLLQRFDVPQTFVVPHEEQLVANDAARDGGPELVPPERILLGVDLAPLSGIQFVVAE